MSLSQNPMTRQDGYIRRPPPGTCPPPVSQARPLTHTRATPSCATPTPPAPPPTCMFAAPVISPTLTWSIPLFPLGCPAPLADGCGSGLAGGRRGGLGGGCASCLVASPPPSHPGTGPAPPGAPPFDRRVVLCLTITVFSGSAGQVPRWLSTVACEPEGRCLPRWASQPEPRCLRCPCTHVVERVGVVIGRVRVGPHARVSALHRGACTLVQLPGDIRLRRWIAWRRARFKLHVRIVATKARRKGCLA